MILDLLGEGKVKGKNLSVSANPFFTEEISTRFVNFASLGRRVPRFSLFNPNFLFDVHRISLFVYCAVVGKVRPQMNHLMVLEEVLLATSVRPDGSARKSADCQLPLAGRCFYNCSYARISAHISHYGCDFRKGGEGA